MSVHNRQVSLCLALATCGLLLVAAVLAPAGPQRKKTPRPAVYHANRDHLWNRLHADLLIRTGPSGGQYGTDRLEPLLWLESKYLLNGKSAERAAAVLEEFIREKGETLIESPLKQAMLQRDLWLVFNWLTARPETVAHKRLAGLLAKVMRRLALTPEQIEQLPDNFEAAVASGKFPKAFDPAHPHRAYLPPGLFNPEGPWVCVGRTDGPTAPFHLREGGGNQFTNSVFFVFLKLPGGRKPTLAFLKELRAFKKPLLIQTPEKSLRRAFPVVPNPQLPQWPKGTEVALVRRAMLIDSSRNIVASPLTESVQIRTIVSDMPAFTKPVLEKIGYRTGTGNQAFFEFQLRREGLFGNTAGGLKDVSAARDFKTGFNSHPWDEFERPSNGNQPLRERAQVFVKTRTVCVTCHSMPGVYSFGSIPVFAFGGLRNVQGDIQKRDRRPLAAMPVNQVEQSALKWKTRQPGWTTLRRLLPET